MGIEIRLGSVSSGSRKATEWQFRIQISSVIVAEQTMQPSDPIGLSSSFRRSMSKDWSHCLGFSRICV